MRIWSLLVVAMVALDKLYAEIKQRGAIIKSAPANMPWRIHSAGSL
ncbi:MAG TPA: hypothetical protein VFQ65_03695 [Kofleriaceae bacterium]|nr:hypothetical protein [Kofleriaceae bacterium]